MRLAYFSPLNPVQSGISDYSEELLPHLAHGAEIDLFIDKYRPTNPEIASAFRVLPARRFRSAARATRYDGVVYQMGNSPAHAYIYDRLMETPGTLVLHEFVLHHLRMWMALHRGKGRTYLRAMTAEYGEAGRLAAERVLLGQHPEALFNFPLVEEALAHATGVIVHSRYMAAQVAAIRADVPLAVVPMGVPLPPLVPQAEARARLGLDPSIFILSSMGHLNPYKRLNVALRAFKAFAMQQPRCLFLLVGSRSPNYNVDRMINMLGLADRVRVTGYAPTAEFADYLAASDVCINLRYPTAGETSAALLRIMGGGKPVLVSRVGSFAELPDSAAAKVDVGEIEEELLLEYLLLLSRRPDLREAMGRAARLYIAEHHTLEGAAEGYLAVLSGQPSAEILRYTQNDSGWDQPSAISRQQPERLQDDVDVGAAFRPTATVKTPNDILRAPHSALRTLAEAAAECGLAGDEPALAGLARRLDGLL
ncbi:MAG: glycosyltransferase family 4 protein [Chloroflexia bacterium]